MDTWKEPPGSTADMGDTVQTTSVVQLLPHPGLCVRAAVLETTRVASGLPFASWHVGDGETRRKRVLRPDGNQLERFVECGELLRLGTTPLRGGVMLW